MVVLRVVATPPRERDRVIDDSLLNKIGRSLRTLVANLKRREDDRNSPREVDHSRGKGVGRSLRFQLVRASTIGTERVRRVIPVLTDTRNPETGLPALLATAAVGIDLRVRTIERHPKARSIKSAIGTRKEFAA